MFFVIINRKKTSSGVNRIDATNDPTKPNFRSLPYTPTSMHINR